MQSANSLFFENRNHTVIEDRQICEQLLTKPQLADRLSLSQSFISELMKDEGLPYIKIGRAVRFKTSEVVAWLQKRRRP